MLFYIYLWYLSPPSPINVNNWQNVLSFKYRLHYMGMAGCQNIIMHYHISGFAHISD